MPTKIPCSLLFCPESNWVLTKQCLPSSSEQFPCSPLNILYCLPFIISHILFCCVFTSTHFGSPAPLETGIEPVTPRLTVGCSNQLSYSSKLPCSLNSTGGIRTHEASAVDLKSTPFDRTRVQWNFSVKSYHIAIWCDYVLFLWPRYNIVWIL